MANIKCPAGGTDRLRNSVWMDSSRFWNGSTQLTLNSQAFVNDAVVGGKRVLDDISLLRTFVSTPHFKGNANPDEWLVWDKFFHHGRSDAEFKAFYTQVADHCHIKLGTQVLAGFALMQDEGVPNPRHDAFANWLNMATPNPSIKDFVDAIVKFYHANLPDYDGISFDIEGLDIPNRNEPLMQKNLTTFYQTLADRLGLFFGEQFVGIATGGFVTDQFMIQPPESGNHVTPLTTAARIHRFDIAQGHPNILIRPMAYVAQFTSAAMRASWHRKIADFGIKKIGKSQFQLGIMTGKNTTAPTDEADFESNDTKIAECCHDMHAKGVGLIPFTPESRYFAFCNQHLNHGAKASEGGRLGQPRQFPHNTQTIINVNKFKQP